MTPAQPTLTLRARPAPAWHWLSPAGLAASLGLAAALQPASASDNVANIPLLPGEKWWGGQVVYSPDMPYDASSKVKRTLHATDRWGSSNQAQPLFVSSHGRFVWNEGAFDYAFAGGALKVANASGRFEIGQAGSTLRDAFRESSRRFFAPSGTMPADDLFTLPQYNTWIELGYDQREDRILKYARDLIAAGYPPGVLMIDDNWQEDYGVWEFSGHRFKNPKAMMRELHALGFKVMLWVCPFVSADSATGRALLGDGCLLRDPVDNKENLWAGREVPNDAAMTRWWNGTSAVLDFSNPKARDWFRGRLQHLVNEYGVDGGFVRAADPGGTHHGLRAGWPGFSAQRIPRLLADGRPTHRPTLARQGPLLGGAAGTHPRHPHPRRDWVCFQLSRHDRRRRGPQF